MSDRYWVYLDLEALDLVARRRDLLDCDVPAPILPYRDIGINLKTPESKLRNQTTSCVDIYSRDIVCAHFSYTLY